MSLSFKKSAKGRVIARVVGGAKDGKKIYLSSEIDNSEGDPTEVEFDSIDPQLFSEFKNRRVRNQKMIDVFNAIIMDIPPPKGLKEIYKRVKKSLKRGNHKELRIEDGEIQVVPSKDPEHRDVMYIAGPSGSGKSTYTSNIVKQYKKNHPKRKFFLFSRVAEDKAFKKCKPQRIELDEEVLEDPIQPEELHDSITVFDDTATIRDKAMNQAINGELIPDLLETGRHPNVTVVITNHLLTDYSKTRTILNECTQITFFPASGSVRAIRYTLKTYFGLSPADVKRVLALPSRWVTITKSYPQVVIYSKGCYLLSNIDSF